MKKKPAHVAETAATYAAKPPAETVRFSKLEKIRETNAKLIQTHSQVLQKLAQ